MQYTIVDLSGKSYTIDGDEYETYGGLVSKVASLLERPPCHITLIPAGTLQQITPDRFVVVIPQTISKFFLRISGGKRKPPQGHSVSKHLRHVFEERRNEKEYSVYDAVSYLQRSQADEDRNPEFPNDMLTLSLRVNQWNARETRDFLYCCFKQTDVLRALCQEPTEDLSMPPRVVGVDFTETLLFRMFQRRPPQISPPFVLPQPHHGLFARRSNRAIFRSNMRFSPAPSLVGARSP